MVKTKPETTCKRMPRQFCRNENCEDTYKTSTAKSKNEKLHIIAPILRLIFFSCVNDVCGIFTQDLSFFFVIVALLCHHGWDLNVWRNLFHRLQLNGRAHYHAENCWISSWVLGDPKQMLRECFVLGLQIWSQKYSKNADAKIC